MSFTSCYVIMTCTNPPTKVDPRTATDIVIDAAMAQAGPAGSLYLFNRRTGETFWVHQSVAAGWGRSKLGRDRAGLCGGGGGFRRRFQVGVRDRCQTGVRPVVSDQCHITQPLFSSIQSPCKEVNPRCTVMPDAQVMSDAPCHFADAQVGIIHSTKPERLVRC